MIDLLQVSLIDGLRNDPCLGGKPVGADDAQSLQGVVIDIVEVAFGEPVEEYRPFRGLVGNDEAEAA